MHKEKQIKPLLIASTAMGSLVLAIILAGCGENAFNSIADESSTEACKYETSKALDEGNYDQVLASSCAHTMDRAAAYVGKAGYDVNDIIENMTDSNDSNSKGDSLDIYMNSLIDTVSNESLENLYLARDEFGKVPASDPHYDDAQFTSVVFVNSLIALSNIKGVMGGTTLPEDTSTCDLNLNGKPDMADAAACAFYIASGSNNCTAVEASFLGPTTGIQFDDRFGIYNGYTISIDDNNGDTSAENCQSIEKKLFYGINNTVALTTSDKCIGTDDSNTTDTWPCPFEDGDAPVDVVTVFQEILESSGDLLEEILADSGSDEIEVSEALDELLLDACGADSICTSQEIAIYLQEMN